MQDYARSTYMLHLFICFMGSDIFSHRSGNGEQVSKVLWVCAGGCVRWIFSSVIITNCEMPILSMLVHFYYTEVTF